MKLLFATLLIHRDVDTFVFNWFCSRVNLNNGFSIPHLIVNDGTWTPEDLDKLRRLTNVLIEETPIELYKTVPKAKYLAKIKLFELGFMKYHADRVVILDPDVFFYRPWDSDLVNILLSDNIAIMDFGSSLGPNQERYEQLYGIKRNAKNPTCNTGLVSTTKASYDKILLALVKHLNDPFMIMEDQGICFAAFYDNLNFIQHIKLALNGAVTCGPIWNWILEENGAHLVGMRVRQDEYNKLVDHALSLLPKTLHPSKFQTTEYNVPGGMGNYDMYNFDQPYACYPSQSRGIYVTDAIYVSGESIIKWKFPPQITRFEASVMPLDSGILGNMLPVEINGQEFPVGWFACVNIKNQELVIRTKPGDRAFFALTSPKLHYSVDRPSTIFE
jgi:hypothetical protein